jgi:alpha-tubulin suppressor-like RCC1 family protein
VVSEFTPVMGLGHVTAIAAGVADECALLSDGTVECWGDDTHGQIGAGVTMPGNVPPYGDATPVPVSALSGATAVAVGGGYACALLSDGTVKCWGDNEDGCLGNGTIVDSNVPVVVSGLSHAVAISTGIEHACALIDDGTVQCWGWNNMGQLGSPPGTTTCAGNACSMTPIPVIWGSP